MEENEFEQKIHEYLSNNLTIGTKKINSSYGSPSYIVIQLKLKEEIISETYIED